MSSTIKCVQCGTEYDRGYGNFYTDPRDKMRQWLSTCFTCLGIKFERESLLDEDGKPKKVMRT